MAYGKTGYDAARLRQRKIENLPDVVVYPGVTKQIEEIVAYCTKHSIPLYVYGGGSSVTRGVEPVKGGISLDMRKRYNKIGFLLMRRTRQSPCRAACPVRNWRER